MLLVVLLYKFARRLDELESNKLKTFSLESIYNVADQPALIK